ncbi:MAG: B12-binding domain-containing radical SAM protein [Candidatus Nanoarchaeia archaeon]
MSNIDKKTKVLLINPPLTGSLSAGIFTVKTPLGLAYIASYLEKHGHELEIIDCLAYYDEIKELEKGIFRIGLSEEEIIERIKKFKPDLVGISCSFTVYEENSIRIANLVKKNSNAVVVMGGAHSSANPESVLKHKSVDMVAKGEGEIVFLNIVNNLWNKKKIKSIPGTIILGKNNKLKANKAAGRVENLDDIPFPARHLLPMERYLKHPQNSIANIRGPTTEIISSRGCPYKCIFCSIHTVTGRNWRGRSPKNVVDELEQLHNEYGIKEFRFFDDNMTLDRKRTIDICDEIIKRKLDIKWDTPNGVVIATLDEEVLRKMKKAGYYRIVMAIESGSERSLVYMKKPLNLKKAKEIIDICNRLGIWTWSTFVMGFPEETMEDINKTINFAKKSGLNFATFYIAQPYAGTELYEIYQDLGLLDKGIKSGSGVTNTYYDIPNFTAKQLDYFQKKAYSDFIKYRIISYLYPKKIHREFINRIRNIEDMGYVLKMIKNLVGKEYSPIYKKK